MTTSKTYDERNRDIQDGFERHIFRKMEYTDTGALVAVEGSGTREEDVPVINTGYGFTPKEDTELEAFLHGDGSDASNKFAVLSLPRDKQRKWPENAGGMQHPFNADKFVQFDDDSIWLKDGKFTLGNNQELTVTISNGTVTLSTGNNINFECPKLTHNGVNIGDTHVHSQAADSDGDGEADTDPPH